MKGKSKARENAQEERKDMKATDFEEKILLLALQTDVNRELHRIIRELNYK